MNEQNSTALSGRVRLSYVQYLDLGLTERTQQDVFTGCLHRHRTTGLKSSKVTV